MLVISYHEYHIILDIKNMLYHINKTKSIIIKPNIHIFTFILVLNYHKV